MDDTAARDILPELLTTLFRGLRPQSHADIVALIIVTLGYLVYVLRGLAWDKPDPYQHLWFQRPQLRDGATLDARKETRDIAQKLSESAKDLVIFWGSQSGTAEGLARQLARECQSRFSLQPLVADLSDYDPHTIARIPPTKFAIFILSTYGEGDPSDNTTNFWEWVRTNSEVPLQSLRYAAFGLGNSNYKYFNRVVDVVTGALDNLGATLMLPVGKADDANGSTKEDFLTWKERLFMHFRSELCLSERDSTYNPALSVEYEDSMKVANIHSSVPDQDIRPRLSTAFQSLPIRCTRNLIPHSDRKCIHMELDLSAHSELRYKTGDHLAISPVNTAEEVDLLLRLLNLADCKNALVSIKSLEENTNLKIPSPSSISTIFRNHLDISAPVPRDTVLSLAQFASSQQAKTFLSTISHSKSTWTSFTSKHHITLPRLLSLASLGHSWPNLPLSFLFETLPPLSPRYYSISSSSIISPRTPSITVSVSNSPVPLCPRGTMIPGLASNYLLNLSQDVQQQQHQTAPQPQSMARPAHSILAALHPSTFRPPSSPSTPLILIASGTGIAPFRAFILERLRLHALNPASLIGPTLLFFGCRDPRTDFLYREELEDAARRLPEGKLEAVVAFSRGEGGEGGKRGYVQERVGERVGEVLRWIEEEGARVYVCGRGVMARGVRGVVGRGMGESRGWDEGRVEEWREGLRRRGRWREDVWG
ncbi:MAG: hypothetical protein Q9160_008413 [Pyrenula sp. 1 TL-2023]